MALGLAWFAWRRMQEARAALQHKVAIEAELTAALTENRRLERATIRVQEEERRNLARELHDELGQYLNAIKVDAVYLRDANPLLPADAKRCASLIIGIVDRVQRTVHDVVRRLRPTGLDELGLAAAIEDCLDEWRRRLPAISFDSQVPPGLTNLGEAVNMTLYRLVQEGLTNVARHAKAKHVAVTIEQHDADSERPAFVVLRISDDGAGPSMSTPGLGLVGMRERVEALGGVFEASNTTDRGFRIAARLPLQEALV
jgi:signal transduction histidine kinase